MGKYNKAKEELLINGYTLIKSDEFYKIKMDLIKNLKDMALIILSKCEIEKKILNYLQDLSFQELIDWCINNETDNYFSQKFYELFPANPFSISLVGNPFFLTLAKELGLEEPVPSTLPIIRIDRPSEEIYKTPSHQDFWFSMLSKTSITLWFSIIENSKEMGFLNIFPRSHVEGIYPIKFFSEQNPFVIFNEPNEDNFIEVNPSKDELLIFSQFLIHKSGNNISQKPRVTMQIRYNDLLTCSKMTSSYTVNQSVYSSKKQKEWLDKSKSFMRKKTK